MRVIQPLIKNGASIKLWDRKSTLHRKGGLIGQVSYFGSDNLDFRGQIHNSESVVYTDSLHIRELYKKDFTRDVRLTKDLSQEYIDQIYRSATFKDFVIAKAITKWSR